MVCRVVFFFCGDFHLVLRLYDRFGLGCICFCARRAAFADLFFCARLRELFLESPLWIFRALCRTARSNLYLNPSRENWDYFRAVHVDIKTGVRILKLSDLHVRS